MVKRDFGRKILPIFGKSQKHKMTASLTSTWIVETMIDNSVVIVVVPVVAPVAVAPVAVEATVVVVVEVTVVFETDGVAVAPFASVLVV